MHLLYTPDPPRGIMRTDQHQHLHLLLPHQLLQLPKINLKPPLLHPQLRLVTPPTHHPRILNKHIVRGREHHNSLPRIRIDIQTLCVELCEATSLDNLLGFDVAVVAGFYPGDDGLFEGGWGEGVSEVHRRDLLGDFLFDFLAEWEVHVGDA